MTLIERLPSAPVLPAPVLLTARLRLRAPQGGDASAIAALANDRRIAENTARIPHPYESRHAEAFIAEARGENAKGDGLCLAITQKRQPNEMIGVIGLHGAANRGTATLGFWLGRPFWGQGLMSEAAGAFIDLVFGMTTLQNVESHVLPCNIALTALFA